MRKKGVSLEIERFRRGEEEEFRIASKKEVLFILSDIAEKGTRVLLYYNANSQFIVTTLLTATADGIWLETGPNQEDNQHILQSDHVTVVSMHRGVKIQFSAPAVHLAPPSNDAFYLEFPDYILRIQRRNFFRLSIPLSIALECVIPVKSNDPEQADQPPVMRKLQIADISGGGLSLSCENNETDLTFGRVFPDCTIALPNIDNITVTLVVRNIIETSLNNEVTGKRIGCQFLDLDLKTSTLLQRYISRLQSEELVNQRA